MSTSSLQLVRIEAYDATRMRIEWNDGEKFAVPFRELRFYCPCARCVDEHTGRRTLERNDVEESIRPKQAQVVGRYALAIHFDDGHQTGIYPFDYLHDLCGAHGKRI